MKECSFPEGVFEYSRTFKSMGFEIRTDELVSSACRHCHSEEIKIEPHPANRNETLEFRYYICPRVVIIPYDAGFGKQRACLDCILEAAKEILKSDNNALSLPG